MQAGHGGARRSDRAAVPALSVAQIAARVGRASSACGVMSAR